MAIGAWDERKARQWVQQQLDTQVYDPPVGIIHISKLANVSPHTPRVWRMRSDPRYRGVRGDGPINPPMPPEDPTLTPPGTTSRKLWRSMVIMRWLWESNRWWVTSSGSVETCGRPDVREARSERRSGRAA